MDILKQKDNIFWLVLLGIIFIPISSVIKMGPDIWYVQVVWLFTFLCVGIALQLWKLNKWLSIFLIILIYSAVITANQGLRSLFHLFIASISFLAAYRISLFTKQQREYLLKTVLVLFCIQSAWMILQLFNLDPIFSNIVDRTKDDPVGFSGSRNQIGLFFAITGPLVLALAPYLILFTILGLWFSLTTAAFVAFAVSIFVYSLFYLKNLTVGILVIIILASSVFFLNYEKFTIDVYKERFGLIKHSVKEVITGKALMKQSIADIAGKEAFRLTEVSTNMWQGFGIGNFIRISPMTQYQFMDVGPRENWPTHRYEHMHNDYFEILYETGFVGFFAMIALLIGFFMDFIKANKSKLFVVSFCCILAQMVAALGIYTVYTAVSGILFIVFYGIFKGELRDGNAHN